MAARSVQVTAFARLPGALAVAAIPWVPYTRTTLNGFLAPSAPSNGFVVKISMPPKLRIAEFAKDGY